MDQIEKYIETQKLKNRSQGNNYEKNYMSVNQGRGAAGFGRVQQMEESLAVIRGKEGVLGARQKKKGTAASMISSNQNLKGNYQHLEVDEKWNSLSKKEK